MHQFEHLLRVACGNDRRSAEKQQTCRRVCVCNLERVCVYSQENLLSLGCSREAVANYPLLAPLLQDTLNNRRNDFPRKTLAELQRDGRLLCPRRILAEQTAIFFLRPQVPKLVCLRVPQDIKGRTPIQEIV